MRKGKSQGNRPPMRESLNRGGSGAANYRSIVTKPYYGQNQVGMRTEPQRKVQLWDGSSISTPYGRDPIKVSGLEACVLEYQNFNWQSFTNGGVADTMAAIITAKVNAVFEQIVNTMNFNGRFTPIEVLTTASDWPAYLNNYSLAFGILWTFKSVIMAENLNAYFRQFATAIATAGLTSRIEYDWERLNLVPIPSGVPKLLSEITGVFKNADEDWGYLAYVNTAASTVTVTDWTSNAALVTLLTLAETTMSSLETGTFEAATIAQIISAVYGVPKPLPQPYVHVSSTQFDLHFTQAVCVKGTTSGNYFMEPDTTGFGLISTPAYLVPILQRKGEADYPLLFSYFRPNLSFTATGTAAANRTGLMTWGTSSPDFSRVYQSSGANGIFVNQQADAGFGTYNFVTPSFVEVEWWFLLANNSHPVNIQQDTRLYDRWDILYTSEGQLATNTMKFLDMIFLDEAGLSIRDRQATIR